MSKALTSAIVIDTSVARAAGSSEDRISISCRDFLDAIFRHGHKVVISDELMLEWKRHRSRYTSRWLSSMIDKRRVHKASDDPEFKKILVNIVEDLFDTEKIDQFQRNAILKDLLLVVAANAADNFIASLDGKMRKLLRYVAISDVKTAAIVWIDPTKDEEMPIQWLETGPRLAPRPSLGELAEQAGF